MQAAAFNQSAYAPNQGIYNPQVGHMGGDEFTPLQSNIMGFVRQFSHTGDGAAIPDIVHRLRSVGSEQEIRYVNRCPVYRSLISSKPVALGTLFSGFQQRVIYIAQWTTNMSRPRETDIEVSKTNQFHQYNPID